MFKEFRVKDVFDVSPVNRITEPNKSYIPDDVIIGQGGNTPYIAAISKNNGITGYSYREPNNMGDCVTLSTTAASPDTVFYQPDAFIGRQQMSAFRRKDGDTLGYGCGIYLATLIRKLTIGFNYGNKLTNDFLKNMIISLPVIENSNPDHEYTVDDIDWQYMRDRITELECDRITELDAYLQATGLNDYELTEDDKKILSLSAKRAFDEEGDLEDVGKDEVRFGEFVLGGDDGLFNIYSPKKRFNANTITFGGKYPYVARGSSNNGIRGYITEDEKYLSPAKSLSFGQDTATVYYQPDAYFTGDKIKVMVLNNRELTPELAEYFIAAIARAFSTFVWGQSSFNENIIKSMKIKLPIKSDGTPDFDYMERYIRAIEKVVIADVVKYKDAMRMLLLKEH